MAWTEIHIHTSAELAMSLSESLTPLGAVAVTFQDAGDQPILEPSKDTPRVWEKTLLVALFEQGFDKQLILNFLRSKDIEPLEVRHIADENWVKRSLDSFQPLCFGEKLWICPSWITPPKPEDVNVILDPGMAFGTGTHPTTALCLDWLSRSIRHENLVIDYGSGSGILAIAAKKLGAETVWAVDNDPLALETTQTNALQNNICIETFDPADLPKTRKADLLIANILAQPLINLSKYFSQITRDGGRIILSGILQRFLDDILKAYSPWFSIENIVLNDEWAFLAGIRSNNN